MASRPPRQVVSTTTRPSLAEEIAPARISSERLISSAWMTLLRLSKRRNLTRLGHARPQTWWRSAEYCDLKNLSQNASANFQRRLLVFITPGQFAVIPPQRSGDRTEARGRRLLTAPTEWRKHRTWNHFARRGDRFARLGPAHREVVSTAAFLVQRLYIILLALCEREW